MMDVNKEFVRQRQFGKGVRSLELTNFNTMHFLYPRYRCCFKVVHWFCKAHRVGYKVKGQSIAEFGLRIVEFLILKRKSKGKGARRTAQGIRLTNKQLCQFMAETDKSWFQEDSSWRKRTHHDRGVNND